MAAVAGRLDVMSLAFSRRQNHSGSTSYARGRVPAILLNYYFPNRIDLDYARFQQWSSRTTAWLDMADALKKSVGNHLRFAACIERTVQLANAYEEG